MEDDDSRPETTYKFTIVKLSHTLQSMLLPSFFVRNLPWRVVVKRSDNQEYFGLFLRCNSNSKLGGWMCHANVEFRLLSSENPEHEPFVKKINHNFNSEVNECGLGAFMEWDHILDPKNGYIKDGNITLEVQVSADEPKDISSELKQKDNLEVTFRLTVPNASQMLANKTVSSPPCYVHDLPWRILVKRRAKRWGLGLFLQCDGDDKSAYWSCNATAEFRLLSLGQPGFDPYAREITHIFYSEENICGFRRFIGFSCIRPWSSYRYLKDDSITLEVHLIAEKPRYFSSNSTELTGPYPRDKLVTVTQSNPALHIKNDSVVTTKEAQTQQILKKDANLVPLAKKEAVGDFDDFTFRDENIMCPLCSVLIQVPIFTCETGHNVCRLCYNHLEECTLCGKPFTVMRNKALEAVVESKILRKRFDRRKPCANQSFGCTFNGDIFEMDMHNYECQFFAVDCVIEGCKWKDQLCRILDHFNENHLTNYIELDKFITTKIDLDKSMIETQMFGFAGGYFVYYFQVDAEAKTACWVLLRYGWPSECLKWIFDLTIIDRRPWLRRSVTLSGTFRIPPCLINLSYFGNLSMLPLSVIKSYLSEDGTLTFKLNVRKK